ncbi:MFS transporter [Clostridium sp. DL1XJH146]
MFPAFIPKNSIFLGLTFLGLIIASGRILDAVTDPIIANLSDRSTNPLGKRRFFMLISAFPISLLGFLAFFPPFIAETFSNGFYLTAVLIFFYISLTTYVVPCSALVGELGYTKIDSLNLSTFSSIGWALGFAFGNLIYLFQSLFENTGVSPLKSFQYSIAIFSLVSFFMLFVPAYFIKEKNLDKKSSTSLLKSLNKVLLNSNFKVFLLGEMSYWFALTFIQTGISYYIVTLLDLDKSFATFAMLIVFIVSFVFYVPINFISRKIGKRKTELIGFFILAIDYVLVLFLGKLPISPEAQIYTVAVIASIPMGIFGIMPFAIIADLAEKDGQDTGEYNIGVFYALRGLFMKIGTSLAGLVFPTIILWGTSNVNATGIRMTGLFGLIFCLLGFFFMYRFKENGSF